MTAVLQYFSKFITNIHVRVSSWSVNFFPRSDMVFVGGYNVIAWLPREHFINSLHIIDLETKLLAHKISLPPSDNPSCSGKLNFFCDDSKLLCFWCYRFIIYRVSTGQLLNICDVNSGQLLKMFSGKVMKN